MRPTAPDRLDHPVPGDTPVVIVCTYPDGTLPAAWFRAYTRLKRTIRRRGLWARVELAPLTGLPPRVDVLALPESLVDTPGVPGVGELVVAPPGALVAAVEEVVAHLVRGGRLRVGPPPSAAIAVHRGFRALGDRARPSG